MESDTLVPAAPSATPAAMRAHPTPPRSPCPGRRQRRSFIGGFGLVYGALTFALTVAVAVPLYATQGVHHYPVSIPSLWLGTTLLTACFGMLGVALGALTRNAVGAIIAALGWVFLVELAILQPLAPTVAKWLPTGAAIALTTPADQPGTN